MVDRMSIHDFDPHRTARTGSQIAEERTRAASVGKETVKSTPGYGILEQCTKSGCQYWVRIGGPNSTTMIAASGRQAPEPYADRGAAERDAEVLRQRNARDVERSRWRPNFRTEPATYTVVELTLHSYVACTGQAGSEHFSPRRH
jgi:hypothetical protein